MLLLLLLSLQYFSKTNSDIIHCAINYALVIGFPKWGGAGDLAGLRWGLLTRTMHVKALVSPNLWGIFLSMSHQVPSFMGSQTPNKN